MVQLVRASARKDGNPGQNPGPGENYFLKLTTQDLQEGYSENLNFHPSYFTWNLKMINSEYELFHRN